MDYELDIDLPNQGNTDVSVDGNGKITLVIEGGYQNISVKFDIAEFKKIIKQAEIHQAKWDITVNILNELHKM
jgi:hypothetical protein